MQARSIFKYRLVNPLRFVAESVADLAGSKRSCHILIASDFQQYTSEQQFAPIFRHTERLGEESGIRFTHLYVDDAARMPAAMLQSFDAILLKYGFLTTADKVLATTRLFRDKAGTDTPILYFDGDDDICILWPELLSLVDLYVKKHVFAQTERYSEERIGKSNLTDYVARQHGISFANDPIPDTKGVPSELFDKIVLGWNIGLDDKIFDLYQQRATIPPLAQRDIDVCSRAFCEESNWIYPFRNPIIDKLQGLEPDCKVLTPAARVSQEIYYEEMLQSKICVSPFGYGEVCWRDFEAILCGSVLVKPDMDHLRTTPDIFRAHETYVPVRWDLTDLGDVVRELLADEARMEKLRTAAMETIDDYYKRECVIRDLISLLNRAGVKLNTQKIEA